jgi:DNA-directed RNA polymerase specialized sigma24 family protein
MKLYDYIRDARKIVHQKYGPGFSVNEELVGEVAGMMMHSDNTFDGRGSLQGRRYQYALYAISHYLRNEKKYKAEKLPDLGYVHLDINEVLEEINLLPEPKGRCIKEHFLNSRTYRDIAKEIDVSPEMVRLYINSGIKILKERFDVDLDKPVKKLGVSTVSAKG